MDKEKNKSDKPEAYPKPTESDSQFRNQTEFIDQKPNDFEDQRASDQPSLKENSNREKNGKGED